jgi:hypothetical protein
MNEGYFNLTKVLDFIYKWEMLISPPLKVVHRVHSTYLADVIPALEESYSDIYSE